MFRKTKQVQRKQSKPKVQQFLQQSNNMRFKMVLVEQEKQPVASTKLSSDNCIKSDESPIEFKPTATSTPKRKSNTIEERGTKLESRVTMSQFLGEIPRTQKKHNQEPDGSTRNSDRSVPQVAVKPSQAFETVVINDFTNVDDCSLEEVLRTPKTHQQEPIGSTKNKTPPQVALKLRNFIHQGPKAFETVVVNDFTDDDGYSLREVPRTPKSQQQEPIGSTKNSDRYVPQVAVKPRQAFKTVVINDFTDDDVYSLEENEDIQIPALPVSSTNLLRQKKIVKTPQLNLDSTKDCLRNIFNRESSSNLAGTVLFRNIVESILNATDGEESSSKRLENQFLKRFQPFAVNNSRKNNFLDSVENACNPKSVDLLEMPSFLLKTDRLGFELEHIWNPPLQTVEASNGTMEVPDIWLDCEKGNILHLIGRAGQLDSKYLPHMESSTTRAPNVPTMFSQRKRINPIELTINDSIYPNLSSFFHGSDQELLGRQDFERDLNNFRCKESKRGINRFGNAVLEFWKKDEDLSFVCNLV